MTQFKRVVRFMINRNDGASQYDIQIDKALSDQSNEFSYIVKDINDFKSLPRVLALIIFWMRAQYILLFGQVDVVIVSPWMMLIYPKYVSIISIAHHYDPEVFKGIRKIYIKFSNWLFILQRSRVNLVVSCSKYWSEYYRKKGFQYTETILNGFDIDLMKKSVSNLDANLILKRFDLVSKNYIHLGSYGPAKGQKIAIKFLKKFNLPMVATNSAKLPLDSDLKDLKFINASFEEYNVLLKHARAVICMSEFKEGWCRVLHEAAIHSTPILGSGLGGMNELLEIGGFKPSSSETLYDDFRALMLNKSISNEKFDPYRTFTLEKFYTSWRHCIKKILHLN